MRNVALRTLSASLALTLATAHAALGQADYQLRVTPELRADVVRLDGRYRAEVGGGVQIPMGYYTRIGVTAATGLTGANPNGRLDLVGRFLFDPFLQQRWGMSAGAGISLRKRGNDRLRPFLLTVIDLEGPHSASGISPALQIGLGGGVRLGGAIRWGAVRNR